MKTLSKDNMKIVIVLLNVYDKQIDIDVGVVQVNNLVRLGKKRGWQDQNKT